MTSHENYRSCALTPQEGNNYAPISEMCLTRNGIPRIGSAVCFNSNYSISPLCRKWQSFWKKTAALNSEYLGRELNLRLTVNMRL